MFCTAASRINLAPASAISVYKHLRLHGPRAPYPCTCAYVYAARAYARRAISRIGRASLLDSARCHSNLFGRVFFKKLAVAHAVQREAGKTGSMSKKKSD